MAAEFNVNQYWLERGRTYIDERRTPAEFHRLQERFLVDVLKRSGLPLRRVLEIGCGFGRITRLLADTWPAAEITALDLSPEQLANARQYCGGRRRLRFEQYDFYSGCPLPGDDYDVVIAIEVLLHHPPEFVAGFLRKLAAVSAYLVNIDWSENWAGPLPEHVWVHDYAQLYAATGLTCATFALPQKVDGKQQKLFIAGRDLPAEAVRLEQSLKPAAGTNPCTPVSDSWTERLRLATDDVARLIPRGCRFILVDDAQWGLVRALSGHGVIPFLEKDGQYWGPPADDETAWQELQRLKRAGATHLVFAWPSFWWLQHYLGFAQQLRETFPCVLENDRLLVFKLAP